MISPNCMPNKSIVRRHAVTSASCKQQNTSLTAWLRWFNTSFARSKRFGRIIGTSSFWISSLLPFIESTRQRRPRPSSRYVLAIQPQSTRASYLQNLIFGFRSSRFPFPAFPGTWWCGPHALGPNGPKVPKSKAIRKNWLLNGTTKNNMIFWRTFMPKKNGVRVANLIKQFGLCTQMKSHVSTMFLLRILRNSWYV